MSGSASLVVLRTRQFSQHLQRRDRSGTSRDLLAWLPRLSGSIIVVLVLYLMSHEACVAVSPVPSIICLLFPGFHTLACRHFWAEGEARPSSVLTCILGHLSDSRRYR